MFNSEGININNCQFVHTGMTGLSVANSDDVQVQQNVFMDMGYHGLLIKDNKPTRNVKISNNYFDGCGTSRFWEPSYMFIIADNIQVLNNEITNTANWGIFVKSLPHGASYWADSGVVEPTRDDVLIHIEYNHIHHFGQAILSDFGAVKTGIYTVRGYP